MQVLLYSIFWILILSAKFLFNFFFMIRPLVASTRAVWNLDVGGMYDLGFVTFSDRHNVGVLVGIWISVGFIYFIDLQVRYGILMGGRDCLVFVFCYTREVLEQTSFPMAA